VSFARPVVLSTLAIAAGLLASCGGDDDEESALLSGHESVAVIEGWVETLSEGNVDGAADYFVLPSVAENGPVPVTLRSHADAVAFNRSLPCGAELLRARRHGRFIAATFRLTERPGGDCGTGTGSLARTAFVIRDGKIVQWRRLPDAPAQNQRRGSEPLV
jgi:hypothetical protein